MRYILSFPAIALVIIAFNILGISGQWMDSESLVWDGVLPSDAEFYLKVSDFFIMAGLVALFFEIIKAARLGPGTIAAFFFLVIMSLIDVVAGYSVSILSARRDFSVNNADGAGL